jgi:ABC-type transport system involved in multi-copper enzyme maturation permease subunit
MKHLSSLTQNPIILHAMRGRRRNWRMNTAIFLALASYLPCVFVLGLGVLTGLAPDPAPQYFWRNLDKAGQTVFYITAVLLLVFVTLFAPLMALSAIAGERQRQTLDLLRITLLPEGKIVSGKLVSALIYTLILIALAWPIILLCLMTGGVEIGELIIVVTLLLTTSVAFTTIGLFVSSLSRSPANAAMLTYGVALPLLLIGPFLALLLMTILLNLIDQSRIMNVVEFYGLGLAAGLNPFVAAITSIVWHTERGGWLVYERAFYPWHNYYLPSPWITCVIFYTFLTWFLRRLVTRRVERMNE